MVEKLKDFVFHDIAQGKNSLFNSVWFVMNGRVVIIIRKRGEI